MASCFSFQREIERKGLHLTSLIIVALYYFFPKSIVLMFLIVVLILFLEVEFVRVDLRIKLPFFRKIEREREKRGLSGATFFIIGSIIAISVFPQWMAITAILMTTFGDSAAAVFGKRFGKRKVPHTSNKTFEGGAAEFIVNIIIGYLILQNWLVILVMAGTATIVETAVSKIDDNLMVPIFAGFSGYVVLYVVQSGFFGLI